MINIKLIYDVSIILLGEMGYSARTGTYFCSCNILKKLRNYSGFDIYLYTSDERLIPSSKKIEVLKDLKFIKLYDTSYYKKNINLYLKSIIDSKNALLKFIILLKIIKNSSLIMHYNICRSIFSIKKLHKIDAFFCSFLYFPDILKNYNIKKFILLYDVIPLLFPDYCPEVMVSTLKTLMTNFVDKETYCFCISECTKRDFLKYFGNSLDENKMTVAYISSANEFEQKYGENALKYIENKYKINISQNKYIFSFCSLEHRKNLIFTVQCFIKFIQKNNINDLYFLVGGEQWGDFIRHFEETFVELPENYKSKIVRLGYVEDADVNMLYSNSLFFTFLSQYEGFGMPVLEAMQAGTPVIASNNSSLPEVTGNAALSIDYNDEEACVRAMETLYFNEDIRQEYITKGIERAKLFSWDNTVDIITNKIREVTLGNKCCVS